MADRVIVWLDRRLGGTPAVLAALLVALIVGFVAAAVIGSMARQPAFTFPEAAAGPSPAAVAPLLPAAVSVPAIDATSTLVPVGIRATDGELDVPPEDQPGQAAWFTGAPPPGQVGPAVIVGHVNGDGRPGVFADLADLDVGDRIEVTRSDGSVIAFAVTDVERHPKDDFPHDRVYGDTTGPELRLITCGGAFDPDADSYTDNVIVWAAQTV